MCSWFPWDTVLTNVSTTQILLEQQQPLQLFTAGMPVKLNTGQLCRHASSQDHHGFCSHMSEKWQAVPVTGRPTAYEKKDLQNALMQPYEIQYPLLFQKKKCILVAINNFKEVTDGYCMVIQTNSSKKVTEKCKQQNNKSIGKAE